jgi:GntR family transcriptional regulator
LSLEAGSRVLQVARIARTFDKKPAEYRISHVDAREFDYYLPMNAQS